jgi:predicted metal-dependent phosphoesterase TrpH
MTKRIDLHIHSRYSEDGDFSVPELFSRAGDAGLDCISIADHDSMESIPEARACAGPSGIEYIPGVEITTVFPVDGSQQHILGYFIDGSSAILQAALEKIQGFRLVVARKRIDALKGIGFALDDQNIWAMAAGRSPTATSIMLEVMKNPGNYEDPRLQEYFHGHKKDNRLAYFYREFLLEGRPAYVPFESISTEEGVRTVIEAGSVPVLAHPVFVKNRAWLDVIKSYGILGVEAISTYHNEKEIEFYLAYAKQNGLCVTAGSDFHGPTAKPKVLLGGISGNEYKYVEMLRQVAGRNG